MERLAVTLGAIAVGVGGILLYFYAANGLLDVLLADRIASDGRLDRVYNRARLRERIRPWLFVGPALILLTLYLIYPAIQTVILSFYDERSRLFVGLRNYQWALEDFGFRISIRNNLGWLLIVPFTSTALGLLIAALADRVKWESAAKSLIFMPMAISFVGASVIWKFMYAFRPVQFPQIGTLNAIVVGLGGQPLTWYTEPPWNNLALMVILIWIQAGFAMVLLSAAMKGVPEELVEAARIDGASEIQVFFRILLPQIVGAITVVMTTILIAVLNTFDIVYTMTNGQFQTEVLANYMYRWMFRNFDSGRGSMIAVTIMLAVTPLLIWNIIRFRREETER
ncbi:MAG: sugar ABC transporter permease [Anaerolineae bacterium]|nr:sugar ABC transporter permease [Anaerolineae bacterium]